MRIGINFQIWQPWQITHQENRIHPKINRTCRKIVTRPRLTSCVPDPRFLHTPITPLVPRPNLTSDFDLWAPCCHGWRVDPASWWQSGRLPRPRLDSSSTRSVCQIPGWPLDLSKLTSVYPFVPGWSSEMERISHVVVGFEPLPHQPLHAVPLQCGV